ncbi:MAG: hypothetical protein ACYDG3_11150 [Bacillati bacterium]
MLNYNTIINKVMDIGLGKINNNPSMNIDALFREAANGEERTVRIIVYQDGDKSEILWDACLGHKEHKIVKVSTHKPTVTYYIAVSAWYRLIAQQNTFTDLYWSDKFDADGDYFFRDIVVWKKFWEQYRDVIKLTAIERMLTEQRGSVYDS